LGRIYSDDEDKEKTFQKAIELDPNEVLFYTSLARLLYKRNPERLKQVQGIVLKKFPDSYDAALMVYSRASRIEDEVEKISAFEHYLKSYPNGPNAFSALSRILNYYKKNSPEKAEKIAREALSHPMKGPDKRSHRAAYLFLFHKAIDSKDKNAMEKITSEILASKSTDPSLYSKIAGQFQKEKRFELAEEFYLKAIEMITPENVYGTMAHGAFSEESLAEYCNEVVNFYRFDLGKLYLEMSQPNKALTQLNQVEFKESNPEYYLYLAKTYNQIGKKEKAYELLIETLSLSVNKEASELLSQLSKQLNKKENPQEQIWQKRLEQAKPAVDFTLPDMEENQVSLKDFKGKVVLINFWYPLCGPCQMELPHIQKIYDKYKDQDFKVLLIQVAQTKEEGKKFLNDHNYTMTSLYSDGKWAKDNYGVEAAPTNFFIDRQGRIVFKRTGYTPGDEKEIESQIVELLELKQK